MDRGARSWRPSLNYVRLHSETVTTRPSFNAFYSRPGLQQHAAQLVLTVSSGFTSSMQLQLLVLGPKRPSHEGPGVGASLPLHSQLSKRVFKCFLGCTLSPPTPPPCKRKVSFVRVLASPQDGSVICFALIELGVRNAILFIVHRVKERKEATTLLCFSVADVDFNTTS